MKWTKGGTKLWRLRGDDGTLIGSIIPTIEGDKFRAMLHRESWWKDFDSLQEAQQATVVTHIQKVLG